MKNTKTVIVFCAVVFLTAIGCSDYMEFAEREHQAEREIMKEEGLLFVPWEKEIQEVEPYKDNPTIKEDILDKRSNHENEQDHSPMGEKEGSEIIKQQNPETFTKKSEIFEGERDSFWEKKALLETPSGNEAE